MVSMVISHGKIPGFRDSLSADNGSAEAALAWQRCHEPLLGEDVYLWSPEIFYGKNTMVSPRGFSWGKNSIHWYEPWHFRFGRLKIPELTLWIGFSTWESAKPNPCVRLRLRQDISSFGSPLPHAGCNWYEFKDCCQVLGYQGSAIHKWNPWGTKSKVIKNHLLGTKNHMTQPWDVWRFSWNGGSPSSLDGLFHGKAH